MGRLPVHNFVDKSVYNLLISRTTKRKGPKEKP